MLASASSVKFVGLFVVLYVGLRTAAQLWDILGDISKPFVSITDNEGALHELKTLVGGSQWYDVCIVPVTKFA